MHICHIVLTIYCSLYWQFGDDDLIHVSLNYSSFVLSMCDYEWYKCTVKHGGFFFGHKFGNFQVLPIISMCINLKI